MTNKEITILKDAYTVIAKLWCNPQDTDIEDIRKFACDLIQELQVVHSESAHRLFQFIKNDTIAEEEYIDLFELEPKCALYLGSHSYEEPKTCANAAVSERNDYMIELLGIYKHFGQSLNGKELPDYLPLMVDFLGLTVEFREDPVREKFIREYFLPFLPPVRKRLEELKTPYLFLLDALEKIVNYELKLITPPKYELNTNQRTTNKILV